MQDKYQPIERPLAASAQHWWWILLALGGVVVVLGISFELSSGLIHQTQALVTDANAIPASGIAPKDRADLIRNAYQFQADNLAKIWTISVQAIIAVVLLVGGYFTWSNLRVAQEGQITNRFTQAIGQLGTELKAGGPNLDVRPGGIYALERIASDSPRDHWTIMKILTAYVRENARWVEPSPRRLQLFLRPRTTDTDLPVLRTDIQVALTVIGRRELSNDRIRPDLDFRRADLRRAHLQGLHLEWAYFFTAHLEGAHFDDAYLEKANLSGAHLQEAHLSGAHLAGADLRGANVTQAQVYEAYDHGQGALTDWPDDWRVQFKKSTS